MRDLYHRIGLPGSTDDLSRIERALKSTNTDPVATRDARHILLNPRRKEIYDRTHAAVSRIGMLRANLGLSRSPNGLASDARDFETSASPMGSRLESLRRRRQRSAASHPNPESSRGTLGPFLLVIGFVFFALIIIIVAFIIDYVAKTSDTASTHAPAKPSLFDGSQSGRTRTVPTLQRDRDPETALSARTNLIRSFVSKRVASEDLHEEGHTQESVIESYVELLINNQSAPLPSTGVLKRESLYSNVAPLSILTQSGSNYYIKVLDWVSKTQVLSAFIRGGEPFETTLPLGSYEIKYASGNSWFGEALDCGERASYFRCNDKFDFVSTPTGYTGYTVKLILQQNGNLKTDKVAADDF